MTSNLFVIMSILSAISLTSMVIVATAQHPEDPTLKSKLPSKFSKTMGASRGVGSWVGRFFVTEVLLGSMVFWLIGGKVLLSSYIEDFVAQSGVIDADRKAWALVAVWIAITVGRFCGLYDLVRINKMMGNAEKIVACVNHLYVWTVGGFFFSHVLLLFH